MWLLFDSPGSHYCPRRRVTCCSDDRNSDNRSNGNGFVGSSCHCDDSDGSDDGGDSCSEQDTASPCVVECPKTGIEDIGRSQLIVDCEATCFGIVGCNVENTTTTVLGIETAVLAPADTFRPEHPLLLGDEAAKSPNNDSLGGED